ncbi:MAG: lipopolysaccharide biosynthesis protein [Nocardioides sp.]
MRARPRIGTARGGAQIASAMAVMNVATYAYTIGAARLLGPVGYGGFAAVMNLLLVVSVAALALQATAARRISADAAHVATIERVVLRVTWHTAVGLGLLLMMLAPVIDRGLKLDSLATALLVGLTAIPLTLMGGQAGILQGERRWGALGAVYVAAGVPRLLVGLALLTWQPSQLTAVIGVAVGSVFPVLVGWLALRGPRPPSAEAPEHGERAILVESLVSSQALLAFFALTNLDIVVARHALDAHDSGLYAGGLILAKAMLFLPQFVVVVAFPSLSTVEKRGATLVRSVIAVAGLGLVGTVACAAVPELALVFIGGDDFAEIIDQLWLFALLGTLLAVLQLLVYSVLARQGRRSGLLVWAALVAMLTLGAGADSVTDLVTRVILVDASLLIVLLGLNVWLRRGDRVLADASAQ